MQALKPSHLMFWGGVLVATIADVLNHKVSNRQNKSLTDGKMDIVDIASEQSFPASDPPAY
jgi:hypothetical protein